MFPRRVEVSCYSFCEIASSQFRKESQEIAGKRRQLSETGRGEREKRDGGKDLRTAQTKSIRGAVFKANLSSITTKDERESSHLTEGQSRIVIY